MSAAQSVPEENPLPGRQHGFCTNFFAKGEAGQDFSKEEIKESHEIYKQLFIKNLGDCKYSRGCGDVIGTSPISMSNKKLEEFAELQRALTAGMSGVVRGYGKKDSWLRKALPLPPKVTSILERCSEFMSGLENVELPTGSFRPDVLITEDGELRICEVNARFTVNGFFTSSELTESFHTMSPSTALGSLPIGVVPSAQSLVKKVAERFDPNETLFYVVGDRASWKNAYDRSVIENLFNTLRKRNLPAPLIKFVKTKDLRAGDEPNSLVCMVDGAPEAFNQCILEVHQDQLLALPDPIMDGLLKLSVESRCLNPIWMILILHDKRNLGILRSLTPEELPDQKARALLKEKIITTMNISDIDGLRHLLGEGRPWPEATLVAKPCLEGKGEGILFEKDFETHEEFVKAVSAKADQMLGDEEEGQVYPYTVQTYIKQARFNVLCSPETDTMLTPKAWNIVAAFCCLDNNFLGVCTFRSCADDLVAIASGGMMILPAVDIPYAAPKYRHVGSTINDVQADKVRSTLINEGVALLNLDEPVSDAQNFTKFIKDGLGAELHEHSKEVGAVWSIEPKKNAMVQSQTADAFLPQTGAAFEPVPPRFFALSIVRADHGVGGYTSLASVEEAVNGLSAEDIDTLLNTSVQWKRPTEFAKDGMETTSAPVLMSKRRARVRGDIIVTDHLSDEDQKKFWGAYKRFYGILEDMCLKSAVNLPERSMILVDNQRFVHSRTSIIDPRRNLLRIRFDIPNLPEKHLL